MAPGLRTVDFTDINLLLRNKYSLDHLINLYYNPFSTVFHVSNLLINFYAVFSLTKANMSQFKCCCCCFRSRRAGDREDLAEESASKSLSISQSKIFVNKDVRAIIFRR